MTLVVQNTLDPQLYNSLANLTDSQTVANKTLKVVKEPVTTGIALPSTLGGIQQFDVATQSIVMYNTATQNFILNIRGNSTTTLNSMLAVGESVGISLFIPNGATGYYISDWRIDGFIYSPGSQYGRYIKYQNGTPITSGNANSTDLYMLFIVKVADSVFNIYVSQTKYA